MTFICFTVLIFSVSKNADANFTFSALVLSVQYFDHSMRPNIFLATGDDSAQPRRWYYELVVDHMDPFLTPEPTHLRVGWACTEGYLPRPTGGDAWGCNGVGDDLCSFGFDGLYLWSGKAQMQPIYFLIVMKELITA